MTFPSPLTPNACENPSPFSPSRPWIWLFFQRKAWRLAELTVLLKFDGLWQTPFPYILAFHQAPTDGELHPEAHLHGEFYPAYRMRGRLKYLAGSEIGAGVFTADTVPEDTVKELQAVVVDVDA